MWTDSIKMKPAARETKDRKFALDLSHRRAMRLKGIRDISGAFLSSSFAARIDAMYSIDKSVGKKSRTRSLCAASTSSLQLQNLMLGACPGNGVRWGVMISRMQ